MTKVIKLKIDVSKLDKNKIVSRTYTNKEGVEVTVKELQLDLVELKEEKFVSQGDTWKLIKTHFIAEPQTKEQREAKEKSRIVGDGMVFQNKENPAEVNQDTVTSTGHNGEVIDISDIPF